MKTPEQIGSYLITQGGGDLAPFQTMFGVHVESSLTAFESKVDEAFDLLSTDGDACAEAANAAELIYITMETYRTAAETVAKMYAENTVSRVDVQGRARVAGAAYLSMIPIETHTRARAALAKLGHIDKHGKNTYEGGIRAEGWSRDL